MSKQRGRNGLSTLLSVGALAGLLIWTKLRLVSDLPRSAYAVPQEIVPEDGQAPAGDPSADAARDEDDALSD